MAKEAFYFSHDLHARADRKIMLLRQSLGMEGLGIYWCLTEMLYEEDGYLLLSQLENIAFELGIEKGILNDVIETPLFCRDSKRFWSESVLRRKSLRQDAVEQGKAGAAKRWKPPTESEMASYIAETSKEFPGVNVVEEKIKFDLWWATKTLKNPKLAWRNWVVKADAFNKGKPAPVELKNW